MKIIEHGKTFGKTLRFVCVNCGCVFEPEYGEYNVDEYDNRVIYASTCPECHARLCGVEGNFIMWVDKNENN